MAPLCRDLAVAYSAGIPIVQTLDLVSRQTRDRAVRDLLMRMREDVKGGASLAEALQPHANRLPQVFIELLISGEHSGKLDVMLKDLAEYFEDRVRIRRATLGALVYPALQLTAAWFLGSFALRLISRVFAMDMDRPSGSFNLIGYFQDYARFQVKAFLVVGAVAAVCVILSRLGLFGWIWGAVTTHIWPMAPIARRFALARFFRTMSLMIVGGVRIDHCIERAAATTANPYIERDLLQALPRVRNGMTLVEAFAPSRYLTRTAREMLAVGEVSGRLDVQLQKVAQYHLEEASHAVSVATRVLGVLILLGTALLIGYVIISFYARYFSLLDSLM